MRRSARRTWSIASLDWPFIVKLGSYDGSGNFVESSSGNVRQFRFLGDLVIPDGSTVKGSGPLGVSLLVAGDATIGADVTFDFSATNDVGLNQVEKLCFPT